MPRTIKIKLLKTKNKFFKILEDRKKQHITYRETIIWMIAEFKSKTMRVKIYFKY